MKSQSSKKKLRIAGLTIIAITGLTTFSGAQTPVKSKYDMKDKTNAIAQFEVALNESPEFDLAKNNLAAAQAIADNTKK